MKLQFATGNDGLEFNICNSTGSNIFLFAHRALSKLFKTSELLVGAIEPTGKGEFASLDQEKIQLLKSNLNIIKNLKDFNCLFYLLIKEPYKIDLL